MIRHDTQMEPLVNLQEYDTFDLGNGHVGTSWRQKLLGTQSYFPVHRCRTQCFQDGIQWIRPQKPAVPKQNPVDSGPEFNAAEPEFSSSRAEASDFSSRIQWIPALNSVAFEMESMDSGLESALTGPTRLTTHLTK